MRRFPPRPRLLPALFAATTLLALGVTDATARTPEPADRDLIGAVTGRLAEQRETVPIARASGQQPRSVVSLALPRVRTGDRIDFNGEVLISTTCVEQTSRCIGESYSFDPHIRARLVIGRDRRSAGRGALRVSAATELTCEQTRPNRNHHCPLVIGEGSFDVDRLGRLPCRPNECRLNLVVDAFNRHADGGEVVAVGSDQEGGGVEGGKARVSAVTTRAGARIEHKLSKARQRRARRVPASFSGGKRVVYSQRLGRLERGDVLLIRAKQRTAIRWAPYFVSTQIVVSSRRTGTGATKLTRRVVSGRGVATETNGFNCTLGPSAFRSPCTTRKAGLAVIERTPENRQGEAKALYVNVVTRAFPKLAQTRGSYPPARILDGGGLQIERLRATPGDDS